MIAAVVCSHLSESINRDDCLAYFKKNDPSFSDASDQIGKTLFSALNSRD